MENRRFITVIVWLVLASMSTVLAVKATHFHDIEQTDGALSESERDDCPVCAFSFSPCEEGELPTPKTHVETVVEVYTFCPVPVSEGIISTFKIRPPPVL